MKKLQSVCRIQTQKSRWLFLSQFWPLLKQAAFFEAAGTVVEIGSSLNIRNFNQVRLVQIRDTHCIKTSYNDLEKMVFKLETSNQQCIVLQVRGVR